MRQGLVYDMVMVYLTFSSATVKDLKSHMSTRSCQNFRILYCISPHLVVLLQRCCFATVRHMQLLMSQPCTAKIISHNIHFSKGYELVNFENILHIPQLPFHFKSIINYRSVCKCSAVQMQTLSNTLRSLQCLNVIWAATSKKI